MADMSTRHLPAIGTLVLSATLAAAAIRFDPPVYYPHEGVGGTVALGDISGDGTLDVVSPGPPVWTVRLGNGDGTLGPARTFDLGDGGKRVVVFFGNGDGTLLRGPDLFFGLAGAVFAPADYSGDAHVDLFLASNEPTPEYGYYRGRGDGTSIPCLSPLERRGCRPSGSCARRT